MVSSLPVRVFVDTSSGCNNRARDEGWSGFTIEGYPTIQEGFEGVVVQATTLNTLGLMRARKEQQRQQAQDGQG